MQTLTDFRELCNNKGVIIGVVYNHRSVLINAAKGSIIQYIINRNF